MPPKGLVYMYGVLMGDTWIGAADDALPSIPRGVNIPWVLGGSGWPFGGEGTLNTAVPLPNECTQFKWSSIRGPKPTCIGLDGQSPRLVTSDAFIR